jgi:hypothetical protein
MCFLKLHLDGTFFAVMGIYKRIYSRGFRTQNSVSILRFPLISPRVHFRVHNTRESNVLGKIVRNL